MHHHSNSGKKLSRERDSRRAMLKSMANALVLEEKLVTTKPKARVVAPYVEKLITMAKKNTLHSRRQLMTAITTELAVNKLLNDLAPRFKERAGGYTRIKAAGYRQGDDAELSVITFSEVAKKTQPKSEKIKPKAVNASPNKITKATAKGKANVKS